MSENNLIKIPESSDPIKLIDENLFQGMLVKAKESPRKRTNFNFHPDLNDNPHRFLNVMLSGTYVAPHKHSKPPKAESFIVLRGRIAFIIFNDDGSIRETHLLGEGEGEKKYPLGIDIEAGIWHTLIVDGESAIIYEVKPGPYDPTEDKQFAPWAPLEGEEGAGEYAKKLLDEVKKNIIQ